MLSVEENTLLTRVGPGTPMGDLMRQYWIPALMSAELPTADGPPLRVRLLGENLVAFRNTTGSVGLLADACPHRGASLFFGRNEAEGLRCVYHGWKFDVSGCCVDMPSEPATSSFSARVCARAYPCQKRNGVIFAYMGPRQEPPPLPDLEPNVLDTDQVDVWTALRECNWVQALEGDIDTSHFSFLHFGGASAQDMLPGTFHYYTMRDRAPQYTVVDTAWGTMYGAYRPAEEDTYYWRLAHFLLPFYTLIPTGVLGAQIVVRAWVPVDDYHTMFWNMALPQTRSDATGRRYSKSGQPFAGTTTPPRFLPNTSDWLGRWRLADNASNDYSIDRAVQRTQSYTGLDGIHLQDQAITESMGAIVERSQEHLGSSDVMIIRTRRRLIKAAQDLQQGIIPPTVDHPELYQQRSGGVVLPRTADWIEATEELRRAFVERPELVAQR